MGWEGVINDVLKREGTLETLLRVKKETESEVTTLEETIHTLRTYKPWKEEGLNGRQKVWRWMTHDPYAQIRVNIKERKRKQQEVNRLEDLALSLQKEQYDLIAGYLNDHPERNPSYIRAKRTEGEINQLRSRTKTYSSACRTAREGTHRIIDYCARIEGGYATSWDHKMLRVFSSKLNDSIRQVRGLSHYIEDLDRHVPERDRDVERIISSMQELKSEPTLSETLEVQQRLNMTSTYLQELDEKLMDAAQTATVTMHEELDWMLERIRTGAA